MRFHWIATRCSAYVSGDEVRAGAVSEPLGERLERGRPRKGSREFEALDHLHRNAGARRRRMRLSASRGELARTAEDHHIVV